MCDADFYSDYLYLDDDEILEQKEDDLIERKRMEPTKNDPTLIKHMLFCLDTPSKRLTPWEENFLESIREQFESSNSLSDKQFAIVERIYAEKTE